MKIGSKGTVSGRDGTACGVVTDASAFAYQVEHAHGGDARKDWFHRLTNRRMGEPSDFALRFEADE